MSSNDPGSVETTYGNWSARESTGLWGFSTRITFTAIGLAMLAIGIAFATGNWFFGAGFGVPLVGGLLAATFRVQGVAIYERIFDDLRFTLAKLRGETRYRSGALTALAGSPLPGLASHIELQPFTTVDGQEVGVLVDHQQKTITVIWRVDPMGEEMIDASDRDRMVAYWGVFHRDLGQYGDVAFATATIDTFPATGLRQFVAIESALDPQAPQAAVDLIREVEEELPADSYDAMHRVAITFHCPGDWRDRIVEVARRFPAITNNLLACDLGARMLRAEEIIEFTRRAYDPATELDLDELRAHGTPHGLSWSNVGPTDADELRHAYTHDSATSASWVVWEWPKDGVSDQILHPLLEVNPRIPRKRVTLLYRPETAPSARSIVENQQRDAMRASQRLKRGIQDIDALNRLDAVTQSRDEVSRGAGWTALALIITVTVPIGDDMPTVDSIVSDLATQCSLRIRPAASHQASTFQYGLGLGLVPPTHKKNVK